MWNAAVNSGWWCCSHPSFRIIPVLMRSVHWRWYRTTLLLPSSSFYFLFPTKKTHVSLQNYFISTSLLVLYYYLPFILFVVAGASRRLKYDNLFLLLCKKYCSLLIEAGRRIYVSTGIILCVVYLLFRGFPRENSSHHPFKY